jgi:hypothetical protein
VNEAQVPSKAELVAALRASADQFIQQVSALPEARLQEGHYEGGWNGREILAHVASIEWTYPRLLDIARGPAPDLTPRPEQEAATIDAYNARQVERRAGMTVAALLEEFRRNRQATIDAVEAADEALLSRPIRSAGGIDGPAGLVIERAAVGHVIGHLREITGQEGAGG